MPRLATLFAVLAIAAAAAGTGLHSAGLDPDFFWHVASGRNIESSIRERGIVATVVAPDEFSYATAKVPCRRHEWLAQIAFAEAYDRFGIAGYRAFRAAIRAAVTLVVALACLRARRRGRLRAFAVGLSALMLPFAFVLEEMRPVAFAHVAFAGAAAAHIASRRTPGRAAFVATALGMVIFANFHPTAVLLLAWLGALWLGAAIERRARRSSYYLALTGVSLLALAVDPEPFGSVSSLLLLHGDPMVTGRLIQEHYAPQAAGGLGWLGIWIGIVATAALARSRRARLDEAFILGGMLYVGFDLVRNTVLLAVAALPIISAHGSPRARRLSRSRAAAAISLVLAAALLATVLAFDVRMVRALALPTDERHAAALSGYPVEAADWVLANVRGRGGSGPGRIVNEYNWGGYLLYRLAPRFQVMLYGQSQLYGEGFWTDFWALDRDRERFGKVLLAHDPDAALIARTPNPARPVLLAAGWTVAYQDAIAEVLLPPKS